MIAGGIIGAPVGSDCVRRMMGIPAARIAASNTLELRRRGSELRFRRGRWRRTTVRTFNPGTDGLRATI